MLFGLYQSLNFSSSLKCYVWLPLCLHIHKHSWARSRTYMNTRTHTNTDQIAISNRCYYNAHTLQTEAIRQAQCLGSRFLFKTILWQGTWYSAENQKISCLLYSFSILWLQMVCISPMKLYNFTLEIYLNYNTLMQPPTYILITLGRSWYGMWKI